MHVFQGKFVPGVMCVCVVGAVNKQKDIVFDGTMTWAPFVEQTIAMVRDHQHNYRRGPGYFTNEHGDTVERSASPSTFYFGAAQQSRCMCMP